MYDNVFSELFDCGVFSCFAIGSYMCSANFYALKHVKIWEPCLFFFSYLAQYYFFLLFELLKNLRYFWKSHGLISYIVLLLNCLSSLARENKQAAKLQILWTQLFCSSFFCCQTLLSSGDVNHKCMDRQISQLYVQSRMFIKPLRMPSVGKK